MNTNTILCPKCKSEIPLTDAVTHGIREHLENEFATRERALEDSIEARRRTLAAQQKEIEQAKKGIDQQVTDRLAAERKTLLAEAHEEAKQALSVEIRDLRDQVADRDTKLTESHNAELELRKKQRQLEDRANEMELEVARKLDAERETIRKQAAATASEAERLRLAEKEKLISDLQDQISALKQRAEQGSMQLQGEVLELDLAKQLRSTFSYDSVEAVAQGVRGADIQHSVRINTGYECGMILWETKRTKNWGGNWTDKLREDMRAAKAEVAVLVTQSLPDGVNHFGMIDGVWVCDYASVLPLAIALRSGLVRAATVRLAETGKIGKMEELYSYLCSTEFRQHVDAIVESFSTMKTDIEKERRAMEKTWASRGKQLGRAIQHTARLYGSIQGIAGQAALPEIKTLDLTSDAWDSRGALAEQSEGK